MDLENREKFSLGGLLLLSPPENEMTPEMFKMAAASFTTKFI